MTAVTNEAPIPVSQVSNSPVVQSSTPNKSISRLFDDFFNAPFFNWPMGFLDSRCTFIMSEEYEQIRSLKDEPFSKLYENHDLDKVAAVLTKETLKQKFDQEFGSLSDEELLKKFSLIELNNLNEYQIISDERMQHFGAKNKELVRQETGNFSELIKKHGIDQLTESFTVEELTAKFNAEYSGKTAQEILADLDIDFFASKTGRAVIGDRFKELFTQGEVKVEKDNTERSFELTSDRYSSVLDKK